MKSSENTRRMKVYDKTMQRGTHFQYGRYYVTFPEIRLTGKWMQECGFRPGQQIEITTEVHKLTITICPDNKKEPPV